jgi:hypothetical protein
MKSIKLFIETKSVFKIVALGVAFLSLFSISCEKQLEEYPPSLISLQELDENTMEATILGAYEPLTRGRGRAFEGQYVRQTELQAEYQWGRGGGRQRHSDYDFNQGSNHKATMWGTFYTTIGRSNILIDLCENSPDLSNDAKNLGIAEGKFLRAVIYFHLVRLWGEVPLRVERVTNKNQADKALSSIDEVYTAIINDLIFAEDNLPPTANPGRATAGAAKAFLADVYLTRKDYAKAAAKAKEVIDNKETYGYELVSDFSSLWSPTAPTNSEDVFSIKFAQVINYGNFHTVAWAPLEPKIDGVKLGLAAGIATGNAFESGNANPAASLITGWDDNDIRKQWSLIDSLEVDGIWYQVIPQAIRSIDLGGGLADERGLYTFGKFRDPGAPGEFAAGNDFYLMRYAEVLLIFAEAENQLNGPTLAAYEAINEVIRRAYNGDASHDVSGLTRTEFDDEVFKQTGYEFIQECRRWFDIVRTNRFSVITDAMKPLGPNGDLATNYYWPLPDTETLTNELIED